MALAGRVVTGDALHCRRGRCTRVLDAEGDYLFFVKGNQPTLLAAIELLFAQPPPGEVFIRAQQRDRHGDRHEVRQLWASTALRDYLDWPGLQQVCRIERTWTQQGQRHQQVRYAITSLDEQTDAATLLQYVRGHWGIENRLHYVRDVTFGEDASQLRSGAAPQVMAALRTVVIGLLRRTSHANIAAAVRAYGWRSGSGAALRLLGCWPPR